MKKGSIFLLGGAIIIIGFVVFSICVLAIPTLISFDKTGYYRPILMGMYLTTIPFFFALIQGLKIIRYIEKDEAFSDLSVKALENIKFCSITICGLYAVGMPYIFYVADKDDAPGVAAIGFVIIFASFIVATAASVFQRLFQKAFDIKTENDLTV